MNLILTKEQKAMRAYEARHSEAGQVASVERAVRRAIDGVNQDLAAEHGQPSYTAALGGLLNVLAEHLAILGPEDRRNFITSVQAELPHQVEARATVTVSTGGRG